VCGALGTRIDFRCVCNLAADLTSEAEVGSEDRRFCPAGVLITLPTSRPKVGHRERWGSLNSTLYDVGSTGGRMFESRVLRELQLFHWRKMDKAPRASCQNTFTVAFGTPKIQPATSSPPSSGRSTLVGGKNAPMSHQNQPPGRPLEG
jgi:hypothetical protein